MSDVRRYGFDALGMLVKKPNGGLVHIDDYDTLAQQLAASQAEVAEHIKSRDEFLPIQQSYATTTGRLRRRIDEYQATITRLEATITERDKQLAEAVGLLRTCRFDSLNMSLADMKAVSAYLAAHEGKENAALD